MRFVSFLFAVATATMMAFSAAAGTISLGDCSNDVSDIEGDQNGFRTWAIFDDPNGCMGSDGYDNLLIIGTPEPLPISVEIGFFDFDPVTGADYSSGSFVTLEVQFLGVFNLVNVPTFDGSYVLSVESPENSAYSRSLYGFPDGGSVDIGVPLPPATTIDFAPVPLPASILFLLTAIGGIPLYSRFGRATPGSA